MTPPPAGTVERWAWDYLHAEALAHKLAPPPPPADWEPAAPARRVSAPARPAALVVADHAAKTPGPVALRDPAKRGLLVHTFLHHELQAAELMCWALLAFPAAPPEFRRGLLGVFRDEVRHMAMYGEYLAARGVAFGDHPVRDWFWLRVPAAATPSHFVAVMGIGLEGGNLDHAARFAALLRDAGDPEGAALQRRVGEEEVPHVRFGLRWFERWTGALDVDTWARHLPPPLSPMVLRGRPLAREARLRAGFPAAFLDALAAWDPGSGT